MVAEALVTLAGSNQIHVVQVVLNLNGSGGLPNDVHVIHSKGPSGAGVDQVDLNLGDAGRHGNGGQSLLEGGVGSTDVKTIGGGVVQSDPLALSGLTAIDGQIVAPTVQSDGADLDSGGNLALVLVDNVTLAIGQSSRSAHNHALAHLGMVAETLDAVVLSDNVVVIKRIIGVLGQCGRGNLNGLLGNLADLLTQVALGIVLIIVLVGATGQLVVGSLGLAPAVQITDQSDQILVVDLAVSVEISGNQVNFNIPTVQVTLQQSSILQVDDTVGAQIAVHGVDDQFLGPDADAVHNGSPVDTGNLGAILVDGLAKHIQLNLNVVVLAGHVTGQSSLAPVVGDSVIHGIADGSGNVDPVLAILGYVDGEVVCEVILIVHRHAQGIQLNAADSGGQLVDHGVVGSVVLLGHQSLLDLGVVFPLQTVVSIAGVNLGKVVELILEVGPADGLVAVLSGQLIQISVDQQGCNFGILVGQFGIGQSLVQSGNQLGDDGGVGLVQVDQVLQSILLLINGVVSVVIQIVGIGGSSSGGIHSLSVHASHGDVTLIGVGGVTCGIDVGADGQPVNSRVVLDGTHGLLLANQLAVQIQARLLAVEDVGDVVPGVQSQLGSGNVDVAALALGILHVGTNLEYAVSGVLNGQTAGLGVAEQALTGSDLLGGSLEAQLHGEGIGDLLQVALRNGVVDPALHEGDLTAQILIVQQLDGVRTDVQAVLTAIGGRIHKADSGIDVQEVSAVVGHAGSGDNVGGELADNGLALLAEGLVSGNLDNTLGVGGQAAQIQLEISLLGAQLVEVGSKVFSDQSLAGGVGHGHVVAVDVIVVRSGRELNHSRAVGDVLNGHSSIISELGGYTVLGTSGGVDEVLLGQGQLQGPGILDLYGLVGVVAVALVIGLHTVDVHSLGLAVDVQNQIVLIGVGSSSGADTGLGEDVVGLSRGVLHRGNVDGGEVLLHDGLIVGEVEVRVTRQIDNLGIVTQHFVQGTGAGGTPVGTVGGVGQGLVAHHDDGSIGIGGSGLGQLLLQITHGLQSVLTVHNVALGVQTDDVDTIDHFVEVSLGLAEGIQVGLQDLIVGLATEVHALELVVTGDGQHLDISVAHNLVPNGVKLSILLGNAGVNQVTGEQDGGNALGLQLGQSRLQSIVAGGGAGLQVDIGHNADLLALILGQRGIQLRLLILVGVAGQLSSGNGNLDGLDS